MVHEPAGCHCPRDRNSGHKYAEISPKSHGRRLDAYGIAKDPGEDSGCEYPDEDYRNLHERDDRYELSTGLHVFNFNAHY